MSYDEMSYEELEEALNTKITDLQNVKHAIEKLQEALNDIADIEYDGIGASYNNLETEKDALDDIRLGIETDIEEIEYNMSILEDTYDLKAELKEREREYREMQGF